MGIQDGKSSGEITSGSVSGSSVGLHVAKDGVEPDASGHLDVVRAEVDPLVNLGRLEEGGTHHTSILAHTGDVTSDGIALEKATLSGLHSRDLAHGGDLQELGGLVRLVGGKFGDVDVNAIVLGSDQDLESTEVARLDEKSVGHGEITRQKFKM